MLKFALAGLVLALTAFTTPAAEWKVDTQRNPALGGLKTDVTAEGKVIARFIWGDGQLKPYLNLFGEKGEELTEWSPDQQFPHHRGIGFVAPARGGAHGGEIGVGRNSGEQRELGDDRG